jgi:CheY-like chemotaxis protein
MSALALISDLFTQSQVAAAASRAGVEIKFVASEDALLAQAESLQPGLVVVDLAHPKLDPKQCFERLQPLLGPETTSLAFGPHVHRPRLAAATEAGFSLVLSRGQFQAEMQDLLKRFAAEPR